MGTARIAVLGAGAWGTALTAVAARSGRDVTLWGRDDAVLRAVSNERTNPRYLPGIELPAGIETRGTIAAAVADADIVLLVVPVRATQEIAKRALPHLAPNVPLVCCSKGIDPETRSTPTRIIAELEPSVPTAALSGPSFAADVAAGLPTAVALAASDRTQTFALAEALSDPAFRIYAQDDVAGVEFGGALKNVVALAVGACRGLRLGASAEAAVIARGFAELVRLGEAFGAKAATLQGLAGLGDLVLSCSNETSRNFSAGIAIGEGRDLTDLPLAEGLRTVGVAADLAREVDVECPLVEGMATLVAGGMEPRELVRRLLERPLRAE